MDEPKGGLARRRLGRVSRVGAYSRQRRVSLSETLDRVLNKGAVVAGDIIISLAGIDLVYIGANLVIASHDTMRAWSEGSRAKVCPPPTTAAATPLGEGA